VAKTNVNESTSQLGALTDTLLEEMGHHSPPIAGAVIEPLYNSHELIVSWAEAPSASQLAAAVHILRSSPAVTDVEVQPPK
jgi:hypothetical protein